jgi:hypothetical protein
MCRKFWKQKAPGLTMLDEDLDLEVIQAYVHWLYTGHLQFKHYEFAGDRLCCGFDILILTAFKLCFILDDCRFRHAVVAEHMKELLLLGGNSFTGGPINYAYGENGTREMQEFVVDSFNLDGDEDWLADDVDKLPVAFVRSLCVAAVLSKKNPPSPQKLLDRWGGGEYEIQDNINEEED